MNCIIIIYSLVFGIQMLKCLLLLFNSEVCLNVVCDVGLLHQVEASGSPLSSYRLRSPMLPLYLPVRVAEKVTKTGWYHYINVCS